MHSRLVWALPLLPLLLIVACKGRRSEPPEPDSGPVAGYGSLAWTEAEGAAAATVRPIEVCEHLARMVAAELGGESPPIDPRMLAECESDLAIEAGLRGTDNWNAIAGCVLEARTEADIDACDRRFPMPEQPGPAAGAAADISERERQVCAHMIDILMLESAAASGEVPELTRADKDELERGCAESLAFEQKPTRSPAEYEQMLTCIEQARSSEQMRACE